MVGGRSSPAAGEDGGSSRTTEEDKGNSLAVAGEDGGSSLSLGKSSVQKELDERVAGEEKGQQMMREKRMLESRLREKEEQLRKLKMVKMYRTKVCIYVMFTRVTGHIISHT